MTTIRMMLILTVLCGLIYPLAITAAARVLFPREAQGRLIVRGGRVAGSELIGQNIEDPRYFWPRPSATPAFPYNAGVSSGSNFGPKSAARQKAIEDRRRMLQAADPGNVLPIPADLLMSSASGLDPHISPEAALWQANRVARVRGLDRRKVEELVRERIEPRQFGILGEPVVHVLLLNQALDRL